MLRRLYFFLILVHLIPAWILAQQDPQLVTGRVSEKEHGHAHPVMAANVYWAGTTAGTITDEKGLFELEKVPDNSLLVVSFVGYPADTIRVTGHDPIHLVLDGSLELEGVEVVKRKKSTELSMINPIKVENVGEAELEKAACCNLSESFETNPSVDVSFTDAITGTKQIRMLGLAGPYTQITRENIPDMRGLLSIYGLEYIPGPWIESIQLNKGAGSVANGYESIAGQINVELRKPETADRLYLNLFANAESRLEANLNLRYQFSGKWSAGLLLHARNQSVAMDRNNDGFMDKPTGNQVILLHRWRFIGDKGWRSQAGIKLTSNQMTGGQINFDPEQNQGLWGMHMNTQGADGWVKLGRIFPGKPYQSFGLQLAGTSFGQDSQFGHKSYTGNQNSLYGNFLFQSLIGNSAHTYRTGLSFQYDNFTESLDSFSFAREERVPGIFFEYTFSPTAHFDIVSGIRADYHNHYGFFLTPRLHIRYALSDNTVLRFSGGRGQRKASILTENIPVMASSRRIHITENDPGNPYGLDPEVAWNAGANFTRKFRLDYREGAVSFDLYHTRFVNQVVVDLDQDPQEILFYNLAGKSWSTSFQLQADYELIRRLDMRLAYRWYDVKTMYQSGLRNKPLIASHRAFINLAYRTQNHWKFDYTLQWYGKKRLPETAGNPEPYRLAANSPAFFLMNAQISKEWREMFEIYLGAENMLDFRQNDPILASEDPFGPYFDSSIIWGPIFGRMIYGGIRLKIK